MTFGLKKARLHGLAMFSIMVDPICPFYYSPAKARRRREWIKQGQSDVYLLVMAPSMIIDFKTQRLCASAGDILFRFKVFKGFF